MVKVFSGIIYVAIILVSGYFTEKSLGSEEEDEPYSKLCHLGVYVKQTRKCYIAGSQGPCPEIMTVSNGVGNNSLIGECECKTFPASGASDCETRPVVYWRRTSRCYFLFGQGPCKAGEWLVANAKGVPSCVTIPCPTKYNDQDVKVTRKTIRPVLKFVFPYGNECHTTQTRGFCSAGMVTFFGKGSFTPKCMISGETCKTDYSLSDIGDNRCAGGLDPDIDQGCEPFATI